MVLFGISHMGSDICDNNIGSDINIVVVEKIFLPLAVNLFYR